ncbi:MAG: type II toxin-antitoxin system PemK/MazF family toxin [Candidatus Levybacteria bacterium]|nr:type II toxin-antitoxin system PemK/MazF family toxin [Candidatus Levybacteria bacterium]
MAKIIKRGELWLVNLEPGFGREIHKKRPALVVSRNSIHLDTTHVIIVPASTQVPNTVGIEMVLVNKKEGLQQQSVLLPVFIRSIDQERLIKKVGTVTKTKLQEVEDAINIVLDLTGENYLQ